MAAQPNDINFVNKHRRFVLNDDNYIMNTVSLCEAHKQMPFNGKSYHIIDELHFFYFPPFVF